MLLNAQPAEIYECFTNTSYQFDAWTVNVNQGDQFLEDLSE